MQPPYLNRLLCLLALVPVIPYEVEGAPLTKPLPDELPLAGTTSDALHAATALNAGCVLFVTNDAGFRGVPGLPLVILDDLLKP